MSSTRALHKHGRRRPLQAGGQSSLPSLLNGFVGLNQLAGNQALAAMLARQVKGSARVKPVEPEPERSLEEDEQSLAALRLTLDKLPKLLEAAEESKDSRRAYKALRTWVQQVLAAMHASLEGTRNYRGELEAELEKLLELPENAGENRSKWIAELAHTLAEQGEELHRHLAKQLPGTGSEKLQALGDGGLAQKLALLLRHDLRRVLDAVHHDSKPDDELDKLGALGAGMLGGGGSLMELRRRKKKKRRRRP